MGCGVICACDSALSASASGADGVEGEGPGIQVFFTINGSFSGFLTSKVAPQRDQPLFGMAATG